MKNSSVNVRTQILRGILLLLYYTIKYTTFLKEVKLIFTLHRSFSSFTLLILILKIFYPEKIDQFDRLPKCGSELH